MDCSSTVAWSSTADDAETAEGACIAAWTRGNKPVHQWSNGPVEHLRHFALSRIRLSRGGSVSKPRSHRSVLSDVREHESGDDTRVI